MNERDWARSRPSNIQHGQARPRPMTPARAAVISLLLVPAAFMVGWVIGAV